MNRSRFWSFPMNSRKWHVTPETGWFTDAWGQRCYPGIFSLQCITRATLQG
jgi:hypothetical protein